MVNMAISNQTTSFTQLRSVLETDAAACKLRICAIDPNLIGETRPQTNHTLWDTLSSVHFFMRRAYFRHDVKELTSHLKTLERYLDMIKVVEPQTGGRVIPPEEIAAPAPSKNAKAFRVDGEDQKHITYLISTLANHGYLSLMPRAPKIIDRSTKIHHVHPLKVLLELAKDPVLREDMKRIHTASAKWKCLLHGAAGSSGFVQNLEAEFQKNNIFCHLKKVAEESGTDLATLEKLAKAHDWENLALYLIDVRP